MPKTFDETIDYVRSLRGTAPVPDWVTKLLEGLRDLNAEADFNIIRVRKSSSPHSDRASLNHTRHKHLVHGAILSDLTFYRAILSVSAMQRCILTPCTGKLCVLLAPCLYNIDLL